VSAPVITSSGLSGPAAPARLARAVSGRASFLALAVVVGITLAVGSVHAAPPTTAARIAHLEQIIKCPSCADESIAQSNAAPAVGLRLVVAQMVRAGLSDQAVEHFAVAKYGPGEILVPTGGVTTFEWALPLGAIILAVAGLLVALIRRRKAHSGGPSAEDEALVAAARRTLG